MPGSTRLWGPVLAGIAGAAAANGLALLAARQPPANQRGWRRIKPGALHWTGIGLGGALIGFMAWIRLFVGSSRPVADSQMSILWGLVAAFGLGVLLCLRQVHRIRRADVAWRGTSLSYAERDGTRRKRPMAEVTAIRSTALTGICIAFADGTALMLDPYAVGTEALCERIAAACQA